MKPLVSRADKQDRAAGSVASASRGKADRPDVPRTVTSEHVKSERWLVAPERIDESIMLWLADETGWRWIHVGEHMCAVLVFGATQPVADERSKAVVDAMTERPRKFHNTKWRGQGGFGEIGHDQRVLLQRDRKSDRRYITIVDDDIDQCITLSLRQVPKIIEALGRALEAARS